MKKPELVKVGNVVVRVYSSKRKNSSNGRMYKYWSVADCTTGRRKFRAFNDHKKALSKAESIARQLSTGEAMAASMTNAQAASYGCAMGLIRPTGATLEHAADTYAKIFEIVGDRGIEAARFFKQHRVDQVTEKRVEDAVKELVASKESRGKSARYVRDLRNRLENFAESFHVDISSITTPDIQRWLDGLKLSPQSAKNYRTVLFTLFRFAEARGYVFKGGNPVTGAEQISVNGGKVEIYTPEEITELLKAAPPAFLPVVAIGAFAGLRAAEIERLDWGDVHLADQLIVVGADKAKTASRRIVPVLPNLVQWLAPYSKSSGKVQNVTTAFLREHRLTTVKNSGVEWKGNALRHSFISYRLASVQNAAQVALEAGNSPAVVFRHYRELVRPADAVKWFAVSPEIPANVTPLATAVQAAK